MTTPTKAENPSADDTAICPACDGSGFGVADTYCGYCSGSGGVPIKAADALLAQRSKTDASL